MIPTHRPTLVASLGLFALAVASIQSHGQVVSFESYHSAVWTQTTASPALDLNNAQYFYAARLVTSGPSDAETASVTVTGPGTSVSLLPPSGGGTVLNGSSSFHNRAEFESSYPAGANYVFTINGGTLAGSTGTITQANPLPYPDTIPVFSNFDSLGSLDPDAATLEWNLWSATPASPSVIFLVVRQGSDVVVNEFFSDTSTTSYTIAPGVLSPGVNYSAEVIFSSRKNSGLGLWEGSGPEGFGGYDFRTVAGLSTVPEPAGCAIAAGIGLIAFAYMNRRRMN